MLSVCFAYVQFDIFKHNNLDKHNNVDKDQFITAGMIIRYLGRHDRNTYSQFFSFLL